MSVEEVIRLRIRNRILMDMLGSVGGLIGGLITLVITFWVVYAAIYFGFQWFAPHSHQTRLLISGGFIVLLFIGNARTDRDYLSSYHVSTLDGRAPYTFSSDVGMISNINFLSPKTVNSFTKVLAQLLFIGPSLLTGSWRLARQVRRRREIDVVRCATLVELLRGASGRVPFTRISPSGEPGEALGTLEQLVSLDAAQLLSSPPPGAMLTSKFREELARRSAI